MNNSYDIVVNGKFVKSSYDYILIRIMIYLNKEGKSYLIERRFKLKTGLTESYQSLEVNLTVTNQNEETDNFRFHPENINPDNVHILNNNKRVTFSPIIKLGGGDRPEI